MASLQPTKRNEAIANDEPGDNHADHTHQLDQNIQARAAGVFEGITNRIANHGRLMGCGPFSTEMARFDIFLRIIPRAPRVRHEDGDAEARRE